MSQFLEIADEEAMMPLECCYTVLIYSPFFPVDKQKFRYSKRIYDKYLGTPYFIKITCSKSCLLAYPSTSYLQKR